MLSLVLFTCSRHFLRNPVSPVPVACVVFHLIPLHSPVDVFHQSASFTFLWDQPSNDSVHFLNSCYVNAPIRFAHRDPPLLSWRLSSVNGVPCVSSAVSAGLRRWDATALKRLEVDCGWLLWPKSQYWEARASRNVINRDISCTKI